MTPCPQGLRPPAGVDAPMRGRTRFDRLRSAAAKTLAARGCSYPSAQDRSVLLRDTDVADLLAVLRALTISCGRRPCGADAPLQSLVVRDETDASQGSFAGDFYSGCSGAAAARYVDFSALSGLASSIERLLDARSADAGVDASDASRD